jgi:hypothetical protein
MNAYLTYIRKNENYLHLLGLKNSANIFNLNALNLISGQPVIVIIKDNIILSLYSIDDSGDLLQIFGTQDYLFEMNKLYDLSFKNIKKYNFIRNLLIESFLCLSIEESKYNKEILEDLENKIFYNFLHLNIELFEIKKFIIKEIKKSDLDCNIKLRLLEKIQYHKNNKRKLLKKKIDVDLSGYGININTLVH